MAAFPFLTVPRYVDIRYLANSLEGQEILPSRMSALHCVPSNAPALDSRLVLSQNQVANRDSLPGAVKDAFYFIGSLRSVVRNTNEPQK